MYSATILTIQNYEVVELANEFISAKIVIGLGFNLYSLSYKNKETLYFKDAFLNYAEHQKLAGTPLMHPWANRLDGDKIFNQQQQFSSEQNAVIYRDGNQLPLHGLLLKSNQWKIINLVASEQEAFCTAKLSFDDDVLVSIFPFKHDISITIKLKHQSIFYEVHVENKSEQAMPICFGFHPYFLIENSQQTQLQVPAAEIALVDDKMIPTQHFVDKTSLFPFRGDVLNIDNQQLDHAFVHHNQQKKYKLITEQYTVEFSLDEHYKVVQIYYPNSEQKPYICIEPMTALADALNTSKYNTVQAYSTFTSFFEMKFDDN